jgi:hypothetical protein
MQIRVFCPHARPHGRSVMHVMPMSVRHQEYAGDPDLPMSRRAGIPL